MSDQDRDQENGSLGSGADGSSQDAEDTAHSLDGSKAFDAILPTLEAQPPAPVINTDVGSAVQTALSMPKRLEPVLEELILAVPNYDFKRNLRLVTTTALSLNYLQAKYRVLRSTKNTALVDWLTKCRARFQAFGEILVIDGIVEEADLDALRHTNNHHALAYDVMGLAEMLLTHYELLACKLLTREQLLEARAKANQLFLELGTREFGPNAAEEVKQLRRKNFAFLAHQFDRLESAVLYGRSEHGDGAKYTATLYTKRAPRKGDEDADEEEFSSPSPAATGAADGSANTATAGDVLDVAAINRSVEQAAATANGLGLPTTKPFRATEDT